jgi:hypothetical protein
MLKKTVGVFAGFAILTSLFSYKEVSAESNRIYNDVAEAPGPVRFKIHPFLTFPLIKLILITTKERTLTLSLLTLV